MPFNMAFFILEESMFTKDPNNNHLSPDKSVNTSGKKQAQNCHSVAQCQAGDPNSNPTNLYSNHLPQGRFHRQCGPEATLPSYQTATSTANIKSITRGKKLFLILIIKGLPPKPAIQHNLISPSKTANSFSNCNK